MFIFLFNLAPGRAGAPGDVGVPGYRGLPGDTVCFITKINTYLYIILY